MEDADDARRNAALAASLDRLQFVLLNALDSEYGRQIVEDELLLPGDSAKPGIKPSKNESAPSAKRKRLEHCAQCKLEFDVATNGMDECVWHSVPSAKHWPNDIHHPLRENDTGKKLAEKDLSAPKFRTCGQCTQEFDVTKNRNGSCFWHDGALDVIDADESKAKSPDAFQWSCCQKPGGATGCKVTRHNTKVPSGKRLVSWNHPHALPAGAGLAFATLD
ncbi:hypothetical protein UCRNP2_7209 [Neofusicoccum parvum UCRNP2]|uniref:Uncharacterized protein n=1 Tax=Botryosphaeria parva (strain UCR-NP2) TaxID=1287680 RepID=R1G3U8_BOTPV|nr:hypothetical protein UCRNP2_7209 [Neofusicoccum parvum UCRNP2]